MLRPKRSSLNPHWPAVLAAALTVTCMLLASPAFARGAVTGEDLLSAKNEARQTLQLDETVLQLDSRTRIFNADGRQIAFSQIPNPAREAILVEYEGQQNGAVVEASKVTVRQAPQ